MSRNSTRMGVSLGAGDWLTAAEAFGLIVLFVIGAMQQSRPRHPTTAPRVKTFAGKRPMSAFGTTGAGLTSTCDPRSRPQASSVGWWYAGSPC